MVLAPPGVPGLIPSAEEEAQFGFGSRPATPPTPPVAPAFNANATAGAQATVAPSYGQVGQGGQYAGIAVPAPALGNQLNPALTAPSNTSPLQSLTHAPAALLGAYNTDIPVYSPLARQVQNVVGDVGRTAFNSPVASAIPGIGALMPALQASGQAGNVGEFLGRGTIPVSAGDVALTAAPFAGKATELAGNVGRAAAENPELRRLALEEAGGIHFPGREPVPAASTPIPPVEDVGRLANEPAGTVFENPPGLSGAEAAIESKRATTLTPGRVLGAEGSIQRKAVGVLNPSVNLPEDVHVANQARVGVRAQLYGEFSRTEVQAAKDAQRIWNRVPANYLGEPSPAAGTLADYLERPSIYNASPELSAAKDALKAAQDANLAKIRGEYGVDIKPYTLADPGGIYVPHVLNNEGLDSAVQRTASGLSGRPSVAKQRAYDTIAERLTNDPVFRARPELDHLCRNRRCCYPEHLDPVTPIENKRRGLGARRTYCPRGHVYDMFNTYIDRQGERHCRACRAIDARNFRVRHSQLST